MNAVVVQRSRLYQNAERFALTTINSIPMNAEYRTLL